MQSLDSSCQEADLIINDTLKKLKGSNSGTVSNVLEKNPNKLDSNNDSLLRLQQQQQQISYIQQKEQLPIRDQSDIGQISTKIQHHTHHQKPILSSQPQSQHSTSKATSKLSANTFPKKSSLFDTSLLNCNISQIPSQPPFRIFDDGTESPTEIAPTEILSLRSFQNVECNDMLCNTAIESAPTTSAALSSSCSTSTNLSNFNSITSPSPNVPDLLLSTSPVEISPASVKREPTENNAKSLLLSSDTQSQNNHLNITTAGNYNKTLKKAEKRSLSSSFTYNKCTQPSVSQAYNQNQLQQTHTHSHNQQQSPPPPQQQQQFLVLSKEMSTSVISPNKRPRTKESNRISASPVNSYHSSGSTGNTSRRESNSTVATSMSTYTLSTSLWSPTKFFNIHDKVNEYYMELLTNDLNIFAKTGLKQRTRSFIIERLIESEKLNTIVINLYPGNKGYSLSLHYDNRNIFKSPGDNDACIGAEITTSTPTVSTYKNTSSRNIIGNFESINNNEIKQNTNSIGPELRTYNEYHLELKAKRKEKCLDFENNVGIEDSSSSSNYALIEVLRWPYENDQLLQCIDRQVVPDFLMDMLTASTLTIKASIDNIESSRIYAKPNVFYAGCIIAEIRDFRQTFAISTHICDTKHVLLRPNNATLYADVQHLSATANLNQIVGSSNSNQGSPTMGKMQEEKVAVESQMVLATAEPLCLDPDPKIGRFAINAQYERQLFNTYELRRQMKKYTQISINRKRKLDQFTHHYQLELCDFLMRLRARPRSNNGNSISNANTAPNNNPLVGAMLTSFSSKVPRRPRDIIRPIRPPRLEYPSNLKLPDQLMNVEKFAKTYDRPRETTDCQPLMIEEYILETEREDNEGRRVTYHIKLSIFQRPSNSEYLGELYVDRDYREGERNGESCRFSLGTRIHANRYIQQFTEIFTEEGRKAVKITHIVPGHLPKITHTGITPEQRHALFLQQQHLLLQSQRPVVSVSTQQDHDSTTSQQQQNFNTPHLQQQQQQQQQQHAIVGTNNQLNSTTSTIQIVNNTQQTNGSQSQPLHSAITSIANNKNINIVGTTSNSSTIQQILQQNQSHINTQFVDGSENIINNSSAVTITSQPHIHQSTQNIQVNQIGGSSHTPTTHQLSLSNGSLVLVQQPSLQQQTTQTLQTNSEQTQPLSILNQQSKVITARQFNAFGGNINSSIRAVNTGLGSSVPILQAQLKAAPLLTTQNQQIGISKPHILNTANTNTINCNPTSQNSTMAINAIVTSIMTSANQWQQQKQNSTNVNAEGIATSVNHPTNNNGTPSGGVQKNSNASILNLLNSAPAAMTSTPVASGTFNTATSQQHGVTLVQPHNITTDNFVQTTSNQSTPTIRKQQNEVLQNLLNSNRKINCVNSSTVSQAPVKGNTSGNLITVNLNQSTLQQYEQQASNVRASMSALASQLTSPPAIMTTPVSNFGYSLSTSSPSGNTGSNIKLFTGNTQQRIITSSARRDSVTAQPSNAILVGVAAPSPGSDSNTSNASGFAVPAVASTVSITTSTNMNAIISTTAPSPSGSDHSQSSMANHTLLERLNSVSNSILTSTPNISPQQQPSTPYTTKSMIQSPATSSIQSPMSSPHPQTPKSPQNQHIQQAGTGATLNLQSINFTSLHGAMANFPGLHNVQVISGLTQPISVHLSGNNMQQNQSQQTNASAVSMITNTGSGPSIQTQQRSLLVSVPTPAQHQHPITLQTQQQSHTSGTISLPTGVSAAASTQTVVFTNSSTNSAINNANVSTTPTTTTAMLTLPIAQIVSPAMQKISSQAIRSTIGSGNITSNNVVVAQQQHQSAFNVANTNPGCNTAGTSIHLVGTIQQRPRNIQLVSSKQLTNRQLIANQRNISGSTLKIAATMPITASNANTITTATNTPIVMSAQKLQLKAIKPQGQRTIHHVGASAIAQPTTSTNQQQNIQITNRASATTTGTINQRTLSAVATTTVSKTHQTNRRRSATDINR